MEGLTIGGDTLSPIAQLSDVNCLTDMALSPGVEPTNQPAILFNQAILKSKQRRGANSVGRNHKAAVNHTQPVI